MISYDPERYNHSGQIRTKINGNKGVLITP